ncbi:MAG: LytR/AlgR family response regulator transcription factor [Chitinophagaceae bacterium]
MKKLFLIEDEWVHAEDIRITTEELGYTWLGYTNEGIDALMKIRQLQPDILLIDLNLNGTFSGISIAKAIKEETDIPFIFVTSYLDEEVIRKCYELNPIAYLHKPVNKGDLKAALLKSDFPQDSFYREIDEEATRSQQLMIRTGKNLKPVLKEDITIVQTDAKNYIRLFTRQKNQYAIKQSLTAFEKSLPPAIFIRVHKEYMVNLLCITAINESDQTIQIDGQHIPIGKNYKADFMARFNIL